MNPGAPADEDVRRDLTPTISRFMGLARNRPRAFRVVSGMMQYRGRGREADLLESIRMRPLDPTDAEVLSRPQVRLVMDAAAEEGARQPHAYTKEALIIWGAPWGVELGRFPAPLDVFVGAEDLFRPFAQRLERAGATLHVFPGGHVSGFVPEVMDEVVALLAS